MWLPAVLFSICCVLSISNPYIIAETIELNIDHGLGRRFDGIGAISGGGVSELFTKYLVLNTGNKFVSKCSSIRYDTLPVVLKQIEASVHWRLGQCDFNLLLHTLVSRSV